MDELKIHISSIHKGTRDKNSRIVSSTFHERKKLIQCAICDRKCASKSALKSHIDGVHERNKPFQCNACNKCFARKDALTRHLLRPLICKKFQTSRKAKKIIRISEGSNEIETSISKDIISKHKDARPNAGPNAGPNPESNAESNAGSNAGRNAWPNTIKVYVQQDFIISMKDNVQFTCKAGEQLTFIQTAKDIYLSLHDQLFKIFDDIGGSFNLLKFLEEKMYSNHLTATTKNIIEKEVNFKSMDDSDQQKIKNSEIIMPLQMNLPTTTSRLFLPPINAIVPENKDKETGIILFIN